MPQNNFDFEKNSTYHEKKYDDYLSKRNEVMENKLNRVKLSKLQSLKWFLAFVILVLLGLCTFMFVELQRISSNSNSNSGESFSFPSFFGNSNSANSTNPNNSLIPKSIESISSKIVVINDGANSLFQPKRYNLGESVYFESNNQVFDSFTTSNTTAKFELLEGQDANFSKFFGILESKDEISMTIFSLKYDNKYSYEEYSSKILENLNKKSQVEVETQKSNLNNSLTKKITAQDGNIYYPLITEDSYYLITVQNKPKTEKSAQDIARIDSLESIIKMLKLK